MNSAPANPEGEGPAVITAIIGTEREFHDALHRLGHDHKVDVLRLPRADLARRRLRATTEAGRQVALALPRDTPLFDGAVLALEADFALVARLEAEAWLRVRPRDAAAALGLGYHCGNLHWRVRFDGSDLLIALEGPEQGYRDRLAPLLADGRAVLAEAQT